MFMIEIGLWNSACDVTVIFSRSKSEQGKSLTIGSVFELCSNITMKHHFLLFNHGCEFAYVK